MVRHAVLMFASPSPVTVKIDAANAGSSLSPDYCGLSYESSELLPVDGKYYFDPSNDALVNIFKTLGVKSLRVGANAVDDPRFPMPQPPDIDALFKFAHAAGVKVIYSFRLNNGDPAVSGKLAGYIDGHYKDLLACYCIGNEPDFFLKPYAVFDAAWNAHYQAIVAAVPHANFGGPSPAANGQYTLEFAREYKGDGRLAYASTHHYFLGSGREAEKNVPDSVNRFLSGLLHDRYREIYQNVGVPLSALGVPHRFDETNSCYDGGAKGASDSFASALWVLDYLHWWAARGLQGMNLHTGNLVGRDGGFSNPNYSAFLHRSHGLEVRPLSYGILAFTQAARGVSLWTTADRANGLDFEAYAFREGGALYVTFLNKSHGYQLQDATVHLDLSGAKAVGAVETMSLRAPGSDVAVHGGILLGNSEITPNGAWDGKWAAASGDGMRVAVPGASAVLLKIQTISL